MNQTAQGSTPSQSANPSSAAQQPETAGSCAPTPSPAPGPAPTPCCLDPGPTITKPDKPAVACKPPDCCPKVSVVPQDCLDDLISSQQSFITQADRAKTFKTELEGLQQKAKLARAEYTAAKYAALLAAWKKEDKAIVELIAKVVCSFKCWREELQCFACPLLYDIRTDRQWLDGKDDALKGKTLKPESLYEYQFWLHRDKVAKQKAYDRIKGVLAAWEKPASTIEKVMADNAKLIDEIGKSLPNADAGKVLYDVFVRLVQLHLLIAPPAADAPTAIEAKYTNFCPCDCSTPCTTCGPDTGPQSILRELLGPQPYLIEPEKLDDLICCLVRDCYVPAKDLLAKAEADAQAADNLVASMAAGIATKLKGVEAAAKARLALPFDCCKESTHGGKDGDCGNDSTPAPAPAPTPAPQPAPCPPPTSSDGTPASTVLA